MAELEDLLDALDQVGAQPGRSVSAHLDPALGRAAKAAVGLGLAESVSALTGAALHAELRRLALRAALDAYYTLRPGDRPRVAEVALFLAVALQAMEQAMGPDTNPDTLLAATVAHLAVSGQRPDASPQPHPPRRAGTRGARQRSIGSDRRGATVSAAAGGAGSCRSHNRPNRAAHQRHRRAPL